MPTPLRAAKKCRAFAKRCVRRVDPISSQNRLPTVHSPHASRMPGDASFDPFHATLPHRAVAAGRAVRCQRPRRCASAATASRAGISLRLCRHAQPRHLVRVAGYPQRARCPPPAAPGQARRVVHCRNGRSGLGRCQRSTALNIRSRQRAGTAPTRLLPPGSSPCRLLSSFDTAHSPSSASA